MFGLLFAGIHGSVKYLFSFLGRDASDGAAKHLKFSDQVRAKLVLEAPEASGASDPDAHADASGCGGMANVFGQGGKPAGPSDDEVTELDPTIERPAAQHDVHRKGARGEQVKNGR